MAETEPAPDALDIDAIVPPNEPTPGPWQAWENPHVANPHHTYWSILGGGGHFGEDGHGFCLTGFISQANAKILGASFDLYEAVKWLQTYAEVQVRNHPKAADTHGWQQVLSAIAKAEGV